MTAQRLLLDTHEPLSAPHDTMRTALRATRVVREKLSADPWKYHAVDESPFWKKVREALVVNP